MIGCTPQGTTFLGGTLCLWCLPLRTLLTIPANHCLYKQRVYCPSTASLIWSQVTILPLGLRFSSPAIRRPLRYQFGMPVLALKMKISQLAWFCQLLAQFRLPLRIPKTLQICVSGLNELITRQC